MDNIFKSTDLEVLRRIAELYRDSKDMSTTSAENISADLCITISNVRAALGTLTNRRYLIKTGDNQTAKRWHLNPDFPGTFHDAVYGSRGAFQSTIPEPTYPKDFKVAGPAYHAPVPKKDWGPKYAEQLNSFYKVAMLTRK